MAIIQPNTEAYEVLEEGEGSGYRLRLVEGDSAVYSWKIGDGDSRERVFTGRITRTPRAEYVRPGEIQYLTNHGPGTLDLSRIEVEEEADRLALTSEAFVAI
ncbi:MAG TPA: hypothetical protein VG778_07955 [Blastocatellia bacterium]|nr:hypothetical protein [Blastocatellia bacterium]